MKSATASSVAIDLEVYDSSGARVFQQAWNNQSFNAGQTRSFTVGWTSPANANTGTYTMKVGVFSSNWSTLYSWNNQAGTFQVR